MYLTGPGVPLAAMGFERTCICKSKPVEFEKLLECKNKSCDNGRIFHLKKCF